MSKLTDTQLILLSSASRRDDGLVVMPANMRGGAAKAVKPLLDRALLKEIKAKPDMPVWRRGDDGSHALQITKAGLAAIQIGDGDGNKPSPRRSEGRQELPKRRSKTPLSQAELALAVCEARHRPAGTAKAASAVKLPPPPIGSRAARGPTPSRPTSSRCCRRRRARPSRRS